MKKSWLNGLKGLTVGVAEKQIKDAGFDVEVLEKGAFRMALVVANTVLLYTNTDGSVDAAMAGDSSEIEG
jgi:hypothetical protein